MYKSITSSLILVSIILLQTLVSVHTTTTNRLPEPVVVSSTNKPPQTANLLALVSVVGISGQPVVERPPALKEDRLDSSAAQETSATDASSSSSSTSSEPTWIERFLIGAGELSQLSFDGSSSSSSVLLESTDDSSQVSAEESTTAPSFTTTSVDNADLSEEDLIVETNNVSAVLAHASINSDRINPQVITTSATRSTISCKKAYYQCALRKACAPALKSFNDMCRELINNQTSTGIACSGRCLRAMIALRSSDEGEDLVNCDCQGDEYCGRTKLRSERCQPEVEDALKSGTVVSCSTAAAICMADQSCSVALNYYYLNCGNSLFSHSQCSTKCNNSLAILHRQPKASKIISCYCEGSEDFPCSKYKAYTERLCLNKHGASYLPRISSNRPEDDSFRHVNLSQASQADGGIITEVESEENLAGEPVSSNSHSAEENEDGVVDEDAATEYEDDSSAKNSSQDDQLPQEATDSSNQLWIPLLNPRYFAGLERQLLRQQQMERQQRQLQKQHPNNQQVLATSGNRHQKTSQNGTSSDGIPPQHPSRRRHRRILVLASASPSAHSLDTTWSLTPVVVVVAVVSVVVAVSAALFKSLVSSSRQAL